MKKRHILIVEDEVDIRNNIATILEIESYEVIQAKNGKDALEILTLLDEVPDVIISDIVMPKMDGYDFFTTISNDSLYNFIPFIFLSGKDTPEDIRFGKMLGVDDYLTKPFDPEDLIAIIKGKLKQSEKRNELKQIFDNRIENEKSGLENKEIYDQIRNKKQLPLALVVFWDDKIGPDLKLCYPDDIDLPIPVNKISYQLFEAMNVIYGNSSINSAEGLLVRLENILHQGYVYFDAYPDKSSRSGQRKYMIAIIAPQLSYFQALRLKKVCTLISQEIRSNKSDLSVDLSDFWAEINAIIEE